jgi:serine/threonine protein kinase
LELKTLHECDCENVLRSYGSFLKDGNVNIALEFMDAGSLAGILKKAGKIPENILGIIAYQTL